MLTYENVIILHWQIKYNGGPKRNIILSSPPFQNHREKNRRRRPPSIFLFIPRL